MAKRKDTKREIVVNGYSESWLKKGFQWVYPKEVRSGNPSPGSEVLIRSERGEVLARGIADSGWIAVRVFRHSEAPLDQRWLWALLDAAAERRTQLIGPETTGYRLLHGENDDLPGIRIDWWDHFAVIILDSASVSRFVPSIVAWLEARRSPRGVYQCYRKDSRDTTEGAYEPGPGWVSGRAPTAPVRVTENGVAALVSPGEGPDVGLYSDMREVRRWFEPYWGGRRVLNTFSYTGMFSVVAAYHGASEIVTTDLSAKVLARAEDNFLANELDPAMYDFIAEDTLKLLDRFRRQKRTFDIVVLDPPSFSHSYAGTWSASKDYPRLVAAACRVLEPGGWLMAASNQGEVAPRAFRGHVTQGFNKAKRRGQEIYWGGQGPDFPAGSWFPEGRYLKVGVWRVL